MNQLIYIADPMCSWCYGFSPVITELKNQYKGSFEFALIMGGLRPGGGDPWNEKFKGFLRHHWEQVGKASGQTFNFDLLDWEEFNYNTEPACRAVVVVRHLAPAKEFDFFKAIQKGFYYENRDPNQLSFYRPICKTLEIDFEAFQNAFSQEEYKQKTRDDFAQSIEWGIRGFPSVVLKKGEELKMVANGFTTVERMQGRIDPVILQDLG